MEQHLIKTGINYVDDNKFYSDYYGTTLDKCDTNLLSVPTDDELEIYITTFDGLLYVNYQIKTLLKFITNVKFKIIFCDTNSHINEAVSAKTKELCLKNNVGYVKLPHNKFQDLQSFSYKLGVDMNWIWRNCIKIRRPKYFGFIEQDCFLIQNVWGYLKSYLDKKGMYGLAYPQDSLPIHPKYWLVHVMSNFFRYNFVKDIDLDFRPNGSIGLDVSGNNYFTLFKDYDRLDYIQSEKSLTDYEWPDVFREFSLHDNVWLHIKNSTKSFTNNINERQFKEVYMTGMLDGILLNSK